MGNVCELRKYVLKGAAGTSVDYLEVDPKIGIIGDRQFALKRKSKVTDDWSPKGVFYVAMNTPVMPALRPIFTDDKLDPEYLARTTELLGLEEPPSVLATEGRFNISDTKGPFVSFLNLASVIELEKHMGCEVDAYRFRMNVHIEGLKPFEELEWVDAYPGTRVIKVGEIEFRIDDACERCRAVEASPTTGEYDLEVLKALDSLLKERGYDGSPHRQVHTVMGILGCPLTKGYISEGDLIVA